MHGSISTGWLFIWVISASDIGQATSTGEIPLLFENCCGFFKVPHIGLVEVGRLGPNQGRKVVQTGDERPFSSMVPGSHPSRESNPGQVGGRPMSYQSCSHLSTWVPFVPKHLKKECCQPNTITSCHRSSLCTAIQLWVVHRVLRQVAGENNVRFLSFKWTFEIGNM